MGERLEYPPLISGGQTSTHGKKSQQPQSLQKSANMISMMAQATKKNLLEMNLNGMESCLNSITSIKHDGGNHEYDNQNSKSVLQRASRERIHKLTKNGKDVSNQHGSASQYYKKKVTIDEASIMAQRQNMQSTILENHSNSLPPVNLKSPNKKCKSYLRMPSIDSNQYGPVILAKRQSKESGGADANMHSQSSIENRKFTYTGGGGNIEIMSTGSNLVSNR